MSNIEARAINAIRALGIDATTHAGSGHPGMVLGSAPMAYVLWQQLRHNPHNPTWLNRDRFVQSAGHGSMLSYALLHLYGYAVSAEDIRQHRQTDSLTPGHPEVGHTPGVDMTTGPLGQGISTAVGLALAEAHLASRYNREGYPIIDHHTYVIAGDGCLMEGVASEACSLAGHLGLGKLIVFYDDNSITIDGHTDIAFTEDVAARFSAYGWHVQHVADGTDTAQLVAALTQARNEQERPSLIKVSTIIGHGTPLADTSAIHGKALKADQAAEAKATLGIDWEAFCVPDDVKVHYAAQTQEKTQQEAVWQALLTRYQQDHPELAAELTRVLNRDLPDMQAQLPQYADDSAPASRGVSGEVLNALCDVVPELIGGSADLAGSTMTTMKATGFITKDDYSGRNVHFGVREHAMAAIGNGMALHGGLRPYLGTFLVFSDYLRPSLRLAALMQQPVIYVFTHDSIGLGGDGPTHQPVAQLMSLRAIPNHIVIRPADARETVQAWQVALQSQDAPVSLALSRQGLPTLAVPEGAVAKGAYVLAECEETPEVILIGTGSEVALCLKAQDKLRAEGIQARVVSMPSFELFERQDAAYKEQVLPKVVRARVAVEAGASLGWERYVGLDGEVVALDTFGASGEGADLFEKFGFTPERIADIAKQALHAV